MYKVIIADDKALIRAGLFYRNNWAEMGYEVAALLEDGSDVLDYLEKERADVLLADICMYSISGLEAAKVIQEKYPWMKVVLISGYQDFEFAKEAISCKVYEYLLKPIDYDRLRTVFAKIREELDEASKAKLLQLYFHEKEYDQMLHILSQLPEEEEGKDWKDYTELWGIFQKASLGVNEYLAQEMLELLEKKVRRQSTELIGEFEQKFLKLSEDTEETMLSLLNWLERELKERQLLRNKVKTDEDIVRACVYIREHLSENPSLEKVAEYVHLSTRQFARRFNQQMGENFKEYTHRIRMEKAVGLVEKGELSMEEICDEVGYKDYKYFLQLFRKYRK